MRIIYDTRELPGVNIVGPRLDGVLQRFTLISRRQTRAWGGGVWPGPLDLRPPAYIYSI
jgi:hypothetical protein